VVLVELTDTVIEVALVNVVTTAPTPMPKPLTGRPTSVAANGVPETAVITPEPLVVAQQVALPGMTRPPVPPMKALFGTLFCHVVVVLAGDAGV
jgi:hypothetical protein